jgi:hypothetical protein
VSGELIRPRSSRWARRSAAILVYIWLRFEWQFSVGAVAALVHDVVLTIGVFSLLQIRFDLAIIAALLTIVGYSINDTVVIFDRVRENLIKYKKRDLQGRDEPVDQRDAEPDLDDLGHHALALIALLVLGGDVIRGFVFAIFWGVIVGTYSSIYVAKNVVLMIGVKRDWSKPSSGGGGGTQFANIDAYAAWVCCVALAPEEAIQTGIGALTLLTLGGLAGRVAGAGGGGLRRGLASAPGGGHGRVDGAERAAGDPVQPRHGGAAGGGDARQPRGVPDDDLAELPAAALGAGLLPAPAVWLGLVLLGALRDRDGVGHAAFPAGWAWFYRRFAYALIGAAGLAALPIWG